MATPAAGEGGLVRWVRVRRRCTGDAPLRKAQVGSDAASASNLAMC